MSRHTDEEIERTRAAVIEAREQALQAKADAVRIKARNKADNIRRKAETKAKLTIAKGEARAARLEGIAPAEVERKIRLDVHGRPKPAMRGWIHLVAAPLSLAAGIVLLTGAEGGAQVGVRGVHGLLASAVRQLRGLPSGRLVAARDRRAAPHRPPQYLPAHRRHLYPGLVRPRAVLEERHHRRHVGLHLGRHEIVHADLERARHAGCTPSPTSSSASPAWRSCGCSGSPPMPARRW